MQFLRQLSNVSRQDEPNPALWLATKSSLEDVAILPTQDYPPCPKRKISLKAMQGLYWPSLFGQDGRILALFFCFCKFMDLNSTL